MVLPTYLLKFNIDRFLKCRLSQNALLTKNKLEVGINNIFFSNISTFNYYKKMNQNVFKYQCIYI